MKTTDQYYQIIISELEQLANMLLNTANQMKDKINEPYCNRPLPVSLYDLSSKVTYIHNMYIRYDTLSSLNIESTSINIDSEIWVKPVNMPSIKFK